MPNNAASKSCCCKKPRIINIGLASFYEALTAQNVKAVQLEWRPPVQQKKEIASLLDSLL